jgi:hypothetical protein
MIKSRISKDRAMTPGKGITSAYVFAAASALIFLIATGGCQTTTEYYRKSDLPFESYSVNMSVTHIDEEALIERFGERNNPFVASKRMLNLERFMVYEVTVRNDTVSRDVPVRVGGAIETIRLLMQGFIFGSLDADTLVDFWEITLRKPSGSNRSRADEPSIYRMKRTAERHMLPEYFTLEPGSEITGLVVFMGRIPRYGDAVVEVPLLSADREVLAIFQESFEF